MIIDIGRSILPDMRKYILLFLLSGLFLRCVDNSFEIDNTSRDVLTEMLDLARENALFRENINWENTTNSVYGEFDRSGFQPAVRVLLRVLSDSHSFYRFENWIYRESFIRCSPSEFAFIDLPDQIGYVAVGALSSRSTQEEIQSYTDQIQAILQEGRESGVSAWVVDLSGNTGGLFPPMLAGVGPLLGEDIHGYFLDPDDGPFAWGYENGEAYVDERENVFGSATDPIALFDPEIKVAVIINNQTASAGEATAISFMARPNTRIFGERSCGLSTGNTLYELSNGGEFILTTSIMADREQTPFGEEIVPDESFNNPEELQSRVVAWLSED